MCSQFDIILGELTGQWRSSQRWCRRESWRRAPADTRRMGHPRSRHDSGTLHDYLTHHNCPSGRCKLYNLGRLSLCKLDGLTHAERGDRLLI